METPTELWTHPRFRDINLLLIDKVQGPTGTLIKGYWVSKCGKYAHGFERLLIPTKKWKEFVKV